MDIMAIVAWVQLHGLAILTAIMSIIGSVSVILSLIPSAKGVNALLAKVLAFLAKYVALNTDKHN